MSLSSLCNHTCDIQNKTRSKDAAGGIASGGWTTSYSGVSCTVQPLKNGKIIAALAKKSIEADHVAYFPVEPTVSVDSRIVFDSSYFQVVDFEDQAGRNRVFAVYLKRIKV